MANAKRRALVAGATIGAAAVFAANAEAATYTVTNTSDSAVTGSGSLRDAITQANNNGVAGTPDTINFAPGVSGTIALGSALPTITDPGGLSIDGPGQSVVTVDGGGANQIFTIAAPGNPAVAISGLTLSNGTSSGHGGAVDAGLSPLTLTDDTISGNTSSAAGGGVYTQNNLTVSGSTITGNNAGTSQGGGIAAIGIPSGPSKYNPDEVSITNSTISSNQSDSGGGIQTNDRLSISNTNFTANQAKNGHGGAVFAEEGSLSLTGSTVAGNTALNRGGGIFAATKYGTTIDSSTISGNTAADGGGLQIEGYPSFGPSAPTHNPVVVSNSTLAGNQAPKGAGVEIGDGSGDTPITIKASTISGNCGGTISNGQCTTGASTFGGGLLIIGELYNPFDLVDSTITGNNAADGGGVSLGYGGSIRRVVNTDSSRGNLGSIAFDNSTIAGNAASTYGGGIYLGQYNTGTANESATAAINSTIVSNNTDPGTGNDLYRPTTSTSGGFNDTFSLIQEPGNAPLLSSTALITGVDPQLNPLANNGGPTQTLLPKDTSPVIDQGSNAQLSLTTDQRGDPRTVDNGKTKPPGGDGTDIGAVELALIPPAKKPPTQPPPGPSISDTIAPASGIRNTSAILHGTINTDGEAVTWHFQWGKTTGYGKVTPTASISTGQGSVPVSFTVTGLKPGTRYHYRLVAVSAAGQTATTGDATFKTPTVTIKVKPGAVRAAHEVRVFGSAGACTRGDRVTLISGVFSSAHKFAGQNAVYAKVGAGGRYSVVTRIPGGRNPGRYAITARCGGGNFGVTAFLRVLPPPPVVKFTG